MKRHTVRFGNWMILVILLSCVSFITGCLGFEGDSEETAGPPAKMTNLQISGSILDSLDLSEDLINTDANSAVLRLIAFDASKNYIDVIDCATGNSVGTGAIDTNATFTVQVDIRANAGKTIMLVIGLKAADGGKGLAIYKCLLGRMPKTTELPDSTALDSVKITNVDVSFESTAKALFAMEKGLDNDPAEPFFSISTSEVQAGKTVSKSFSTDNALNKKIESESGGAANIVQVAGAVRALAILAASSISDTLKTDILQGPVQNVSEALNTYSRLIAKSGDQNVSSIITQNLIPTELKLVTAGGTTVVNGSSTVSTNKEAVTGIAAAAIIDAPVFNIKDGEYTAAQTISMSTKTAGAIIYYTFDGSYPAESSAIKYEAPFSINRSAQIKAAAFKTGLVASPVAYLNVSIKLPASSGSDFGYYDNETGTGIIISGYSGTGGHVIIPDTINGKPVTAISYLVFQENSNLTSIVIPDSVISIGWDAFKKCTNLTDVVLPKYLSSIDSNVFDECTSLKSIVIPDSVTSIGNNAFEKCTSLTNIVLPKNITKINNYMFRDCTSLKSVTLPDNLTSIGVGAFSHCSELKNIIIPGKVNSIGSHAFYECSSMHDITIPASVNNMGDRHSEIKNIFFEGDIPTFSTLSEFSAIGNSYTTDGRTIFYYLANKKGWTTPVSDNRHAIAYDINSSKIRNPGFGSFTDTDKNAKKISGNLTWAAVDPADGILGYHIYWGTGLVGHAANKSGNKLSANAEILYTVAGAASNSQKIPANTSIPEGATCFLIYSFDANGDSAARRAVIIKDLVKPGPKVLPTDGSFTDTDINVSKISGNITWKPSRTTEPISGYKIYWGQDATTILSDITSEVYTVSGAEKASQTVAADTSLPVGATHFLIYSFNANGNSAAALAVAINDIALPAAIPTSGTFIDADTDSAQISGTITWTPANPATGISGYKIYWGQDATNKLSGNTTEVYTVSGAENASQTVAADTVLPVGATHFLIYSFNANGDSAACLAVPIIDIMQVATPVLAPSGISAYNKTVTITCATPDAVIHYTTNGSEPSATNGSVYEKPFTINATATVKAIAVKDGMVDSATASATYTIYYPDLTPPSPIYSPANNATGIALDIAATLTFSESLYGSSSAAMEAAPTGIIKVYEGNDNTGTALTEGADADNAHFTVAYNSGTMKFTVTFGANLKNYQAYYIELQANKVYDSSRNAISTAQGVKFTTAGPPAPAISGHIVSSADPASTRIYYTAGDGNSLKYVIKADAFTTPFTGTDASAIGSAYTSGSVINGAAGQHIGLYEIDADKKVVKFIDITL